MNEKIYGVHVNMNTHTITRLGDSANWTAGKDFTNNSFYGQIRRCNVLDDGTITAYYGDSNFIEDGSNGQVMVEIPKFYYKVVPLQINENNSLIEGEYYITDKTDLEGYKLHPAFDESDYIYIGAYVASLYKNDTNEYLLYDEQQDELTNNFKLSSISGTKAASGAYQDYTRAKVNELAQNRGNNWYGMGIKELSAIQLLSLIELASFDVQTEIGLGINEIEKKYHKQNFSGLSGSTSKLGNESGNAEKTKIEFQINRFMNTNQKGLTAVSYRGIENLWGCIWQPIQGLTLYGNDEINGEFPFICTNRNYSEFDNIQNLPDNYIKLNYSIPKIAKKYVQAFGYDANYDWLFIPTELGDNKFVGDLCQLNPHLGKMHQALIGGKWTSKDWAGLYYWAFNNSINSKFEFNGGRLIHIPV